MIHSLLIRLSTLGYQVRRLKITLFKSGCGRKLLLSGPILVRGFAFFGG